ncbi:stage II sporulation protein D [Niallia sp. Krafla_26]|uniref:stage II sporulation protein D n=1 Tax=Niallia sp. Krafla_26 TaxID=3064703 RepID=UPI003D16CF9D
MKRIKPVVLLAAALFFVTLLVPTILVLPFGEETVSGKLGENLQAQTEQEPSAQPATTEPAIEVAVYRASKESVESLPLEEYVVGVVASEMPADFEKEALKAQALTARTYIVKRLMMDTGKDLPKDADVGDTQFYQVYKSKDELRKLWGSDYNWKIAKVEEAVRETAGQILTFEGNPIDATFFSTSNGYTENSGEIWSNSLPYLKSVESPWDKQSPKFNGQKVIPVADFEKKLGVQVPETGDVGKVLERTEGNRIGVVEINGKKLKGSDIRTKLGLMSTDFTWERKGNNIIIETRGYGHGVGMSQYGANGMAQAGKPYTEIVQYYYQGVEIASADPFITTITAKK